MEVEKSGFFDAQLLSDGNYDRMYQSDDFANYFATFISSGVFVTPVDQLKVIAKTGLTVIVKKGKAFIDGHWYSLSADKEFILQPNITSYPQKCVICCVLDKNKRDIHLELKQGVSDTLPVNDGTKHELILCEIDLGVGINTITDAMITDRRTDEKYCGFVSAIVKQIETGELFTQFETIFNNWFNTIKDKLSEDQAGSLQNQIDEVKNTMPVIRTGDGLPDDSLGKDGDIYIRVVS